MQPFLGGIPFGHFVPVFLTADGTGVTLQSSSFPVIPFQAHQASFDGCYTPAPAAAPEVADEDKSGNEENDDWQECSESQIDDGQSYCSDCEQCNNLRGDDGNEGFDADGGRGSEAVPVPEPEPVQQSAQKQAETVAPLPGTQYFADTPEDRRAAFGKLTSRERHVILAGIVRMVFKNSQRVWARAQSIGALVDRLCTEVSQNICFMHDAGNEHYFWEKRSFSFFFEDKLKVFRAAIACGYLPRISRRADEDGVVTWEVLPPLHSNCVDEAAWIVSQRLITARQLAIWVNEMAPLKTGIPSQGEFDVFFGASLTLFVRHCLGLDRFRHIITTIIAHSPHNFLSHIAISYQFSWNVEEDSLGIRRTRSSSDDTDGSDIV